MSEIRRRLMASVMEKEEAPWYLTFTCTSIDGGSFRIYRLFYTTTSGDDTIFTYPAFGFKYNDNLWGEVSESSSFSKDDYGYVDFSLQYGQTFQFKSTMNFFVSEVTGSYGWAFVQDPDLHTGTFSVSGTPLSMIHGDTYNTELPDDPSIGNGFFPKFYDGATGVSFKGLEKIDNPNTFLPSTVLKNRCYQDMFHGCTNLTNAPKLPAMVMADSCYAQMFTGCTSLVNAPKLPAMTLATSCYDTMFRSCSSLTKAPILPATTLVTFCYSDMFAYCYALNYIKMLAPTLGGTAPLLNWVYKVNSAGVFVKSKDATWDVTGDDGVPEGWTVITDEQESGGGDFGLEFPIYLEFDSCSEEIGVVICIRDGDDLGVKLYNYIVSIIAEYGEEYEIGIFVFDQILSLLGIEIYLEGYKVNSLSYEEYGYYLNIDEPYMFALIRSDGSLMFEK